MSLDTVAMSYAGVLVGAFSAMLFVSMCVVANLIIKLIQPFLWEAFEPDLLQGYEST
jgi:hypothetical protein